MTGDRVHSGTLERVQAQLDFIHGVWHDLHRCPELGFEEYKTAQRIRQALESLGLNHYRALAGTGTVVDLQRGPGPTVLIRADIDALPLQERTGLPFASEHAGRMHACGHDTHTAMVLGAAAVLRDIPFAGTLRLLFQPSEERNAPGADGLSGAEQCIHEGVLEGVDAAVGLHQMPHIACGEISLASGPVLAAADIFEIEVLGRAAHAGVNPEAGIDAVLIAAELIVSLQTIVSRNTAAADTAVLSITTIEGGSADNIIAEHVRLSGTLRAYESRVQQAVRAGIEARCAALAALHGATIHYRRLRGLPPTVNDPEAVAVARRAAVGIFGEAGVRDDERTMGGEDFAFIAQQVPSCFAFLGTRPAAGEAHGLHSSQMVVNEAALPLGAAFLADAALALLKAH